MLDAMLCCWVTLHAECFWSYPNMKNYSTSHTAMLGSRLPHHKHSQPIEVIKPVIVFFYISLDFFSLVCLGSGYSWEEARSFLPFFFTPSTSSRKNEVYGGSPLAYFRSVVSGRRVWIYVNQKRKIKYVWMGKASTNSLKVVELFFFRSFFLAVLFNNKRSTQNGSFFFSGGKKPEHTGRCAESSSAWFKLRWSSWAFYPPVLIRTYSWKTRWVLNLLSPCLSSLSWV